MTMGMRNWKQLDGKVCFDYLIKYDSVNKAYAAMIAELPKNVMWNTRMDHWITKEAVNQAAWRWVLDNAEEAKPILQQAWAAKGEILDDEKFKQLLATQIQRKGNYRPKLLNHWITKNHLENYVNQKLPFTMEIKHE